MLGQLIWSEKPMTLEIVEVEGLRMLRGGFPAEGHFYEYRLGRYLKKLRRQGIRRMLAPPDFGYWDFAKRQGISPVNEQNFLRSCGGELLLLALKKAGKNPADCKIALRGTRVGRDMLLTANFLVTQVRDISISAPHGGSSLQNMLRQEWGVGVFPDGDFVEGAIRFDRGGGEGGGVVLSLFGDDPGLGGLVVNYEKFPVFLAVEPLKLLAALWESGKLMGADLEFYLT